MSQNTQKVLIYGGLGNCATERIVPALDVLHIEHAQVDLKPSGPAQYYKSGTEPLEKFTSAVIAVPNNKHAEIFQHLLDGGLNVGCEKPIADNLESALMMLAAGKRHSESLGMAFDHYVYKPIVIPILKNWEYYHAKIGKVENVEAKLLEQDLKVGREWLFDSKVSGGGMAMDTGSHMVSILGKTFGFDNLSVTSAETRRHPRAPGDAESYVKMFFETGEGRATVEAGKFMPYAQKEIIFTGSKEKLRIDLVNGSVSLGSNTVVQTRADDAYVSMLTEFFSAIKEKRTPFTTLEEAYKTLSIIKEAYRVADSEKRRY